MKKFLFIVTLLSFLFVATPVEAKRHHVEAKYYAVSLNKIEMKRYNAVVDGKQVVVHTRLAPVLIHKVLPPYGLGLHVYDKSR